MKMIMLMMAVFFTVGAVVEEINRWTTVAMMLAIVTVLVFTRLTF
jgi:hypothetical protein